MLDNYTIVIPARRGSKGVPFKNRKLIGQTLSIIPIELRDNILISTNDEEIVKRFENEFRIFIRNEDNCRDSSSTKSAMLEIAKEVETENIIMLYNTYPERTWEDIQRAIKFFEEKNAASLLCKKEPSTSPFLMMYDKGDLGEQVISHNLYRRQDYPKCFEISHFVSIFSKKELDNLNDNLYNKDTVFLKIDNPIDIDTKEDLEKYNEKNKSNS